MRAIDNLLNSFTTYRVVLYGLIFLSCISIFFSGVGIVPFPTLNLIVSLTLILSSCFIANLIFSKIFRVQANLESSWITGLILFLILTPYQLGNSPLNYILFSAIAMGSKYVLAIHKRHIFNPAAFSLVAMGLFGAYEGEWWIGNKFLFPFILIVGLLIIRKTRKFSLFISYLICGILSISFFAFLNKQDIFQILLLQAIPSWPLLFLGTVMLTEPLTMPPSRRFQIIYGSIVGILIGVQFNIGPFYATSETALIIGNLFSYLISFKKRLVLEFKEKSQLSPTIYEFIFNAPSFSFLPGQYFEWTLGHKRPDSRGVRRYFTVASSPTEKELRLGVRIEKEKGSSFKKSLLSLTPGQKIYAGNLAGDFTIPKNTSTKMVFIAGGIGVTPFRSIAKYITDKKEKRDIVLFYSNREIDNFVYKDIFKSAESFGFRTIYVLTKEAIGNWSGYTGRLTPELIKKEVPDFLTRTYYLSGPNAMVEGNKKILKQLGIKPHKIITDYFPGF